MSLFDLFSKPKPSCPSCNQSIEALPKRSGTCLHCGQKYFMCKDPENGKYIFTNTDGKKTMEIKKQHLIDLELSKNNTASFKDALGLGVPLKKQWIGTLYYIDKKPFYCHANYEFLGFVDMEYEYSPGLKFPGDPDCINKKETENCKCSIGFKVLEY